MSTWTFKALVLLLASGLLAGCAAPGTSGISTQNSPGATSVDLAGGKVVLSAPRGYCIDRGSVRRDGFALIARCDTLGHAGARRNDPLGLISVTVLPVTPDAKAPDAERLAASAPRAEVLDTRRIQGLTLVRLRTATPPHDGTADVFWRGAFVLNGALVGLSLWAPEGSAALGDTGAGLLAELARRTRAASAGVAAPQDAVKPAPAPGPVPESPQRGPFAALAGLFG